MSFISSALPHYAVILVGLSFVKTKRPYLIKGLNLMIPTFAKSADFRLQFSDYGFRIIKIHSFLKLKTIDFDHANPWSEILNPKSII